MPLGFVNIGESASIKNISGRDEIKRFLASLGFTIGENIVVVSGFNGNLIVNIKGTRVALDKDMAKRIMV